MREFLLAVTSVLALSASCVGADDDDSSVNDDDDSSVNDDDDSSVSDDDDDVTCRVVEGAIGASADVPLPAPIQTGELYVSPQGETDLSGFPADPSSLELLAGFSVVNTYPGYFQTCLAPGGYILVATVDTDGDGLSCSEGDHFGAVSITIEPSPEPFYAPEITLLQEVGERVCGG